MPLIHFIPDELTVENRKDETVLDTAVRAGVPITHVCGGNARCTTCRILVMGDVGSCIAPRTDREKLLADRLGFEPMIRLACQTHICDDVTVRRLVLDDSDIHLTKFPGERAGEATVGVEKFLTILFADIRNFTTFSEDLLPYDVIHMLNRYFHTMREIIVRNHGDINNYMGDGLLALFGLDDPSCGAAEGVKAALEMLAAMGELQPYLKNTYGRELRMGIGIHYGDVVIGGISNSAGGRKMVIGDAVNTASRIESCNKTAGTSLLVSQAVYDQVKDKVTTGKTSSFHLRGKEHEQILYEILSMTE